MLFFLFFKLLKSEIVSVGDVSFAVKKSATFTMGNKKITLK